MRTSGIHEQVYTEAQRGAIHFGMDIHQFGQGDLFIIMMILHHFPDVLTDAFREKRRDIPWHNDENDFAAWCAGRTGYPIVDAAMRQLTSSGWMHNRARMIVASFLVKDLLIDWRWGEYFSDFLRWDAGRGKTNLRRIEDQIA